MSLAEAGFIKIEKLTLNDHEINQVVNVWYDASVKAHHFISERFWYSNREVMEKLYIPNSETFVAKREGAIVGFFSLVGNTLASIFVAPDWQGAGIGKALLLNAQSRRNELQLNVYRKNKRAIAFYKKYGFFDVEEGLDENTGEPAITMKWQETPST
ncbi:GNAT family N-acetyltransferase [Ectopseudomonas mendocina]|uniref:GNAT family N-acetyltransferase n=1 Tax=Ectopseudomonas mendocina TaxID=300 RepID=A0ABZ2RD79_ECTME